MRRSEIVVGVMLSVVGAVAADAAVFCQKQSGAVFIRNACKKKETQVNLAAFGAVGPKGDTGAQGPMGAPGTPATSLWAYVWETGALQRGSGATAATKVGPDYYEVTFNRDVSNCVAVATPAKGSTNGIRTDIFLYTVAGSVSANQVEVDTENSSGSANPSAFTLAVFCP